MPIREKITQSNFVQAMEELQITFAVRGVPDREVASEIERLYEQKQRSGLGDIEERILAGLGDRLKTRMGIKTTS